MRRLIPDKERLLFMSSTRAPGISLKRLRQHGTTAVFILPAVLTLAVLLLYPFFYGIYISFFKTNLVNKWKYVGLDNYVRAFTDPTMYASLLVTLKFTVFVVLGHFVLGIGLALLLNKEIRGRTFFRAVLVLPWLFPEVVVANLWKFIFNATSGLLNSALMAVGLLSEPMSWLGSVDYALGCVIFVCIWKGYPLVMIQILAGLQSISHDLYEAAIIDGANRRQSFRYVTLPGLRPTLIVTLILDTVWWFKHVTMIWMLTNGGPGSVTNTISIEIYKQAFEYQNQYGYSAALAVIVFLICVVIGVLQRKVLTRDE